MQMWRGKKIYGFTFRAWSVHIWWNLLANYRAILSPFPFHSIPFHTSPLESIFCIKKTDKLFFFFMYCATIESVSQSSKILETIEKWPNSEQKRWKKMGKRIWCAIRLNKLADLSDLRRLWALQCIVEAKMVLPVLILNVFSHDIDIFLSPGSGSFHFFSLSLCTLARQLIYSFLSTEYHNKRKGKEKNKNLIRQQQTTEINVPLWNQNQNQNQKDVENGKCKWVK